MPDKWPLANGNWSNAANWNGGTKPVAGDDVFADGRTLNVDENFTVLTLRNTQRTGGTTGGTFNFNTAGVTGTVTSSNPLVPGATNMVQITATTGTVTLSLGGDGFSAVATVILHSGNCNFNLSSSGTLFNGTNFGNIFLNKTGLGNLTVNANISSNTSMSTSNVINTATLGTITINGNVTGNNSTGASSHAINQSAGNLIINGNVTGTVTNATTFAINFSGLSLTVTGAVTGGSGATPGAAINTSSPTTTIIGNVNATNGSAIQSSTANIINVTGTVTASATANAIQSTAANGQVYLNGNMVNNNGKMAIFAPILWLDKNNTTSAAFFTSGGVARTLYSADTVPNTPAANNVRSGTIYGAGNSLRGTLVMPVAANVRNGVTYDNGTVGTALFTTSQFITELSSSTTPVAVRMQNLCTPMILGELMEAYKR